MIPYLTAHREVSSQEAHVRFSDGTWDAHDASDNLLLDHETAIYNWSRWTQACAHLLDGMGVLLDVDTNRCAAVSKPEGFMTQIHAHVCTCAEGGRGEFRVD